MQSVPDLSALQAQTLALKAGTEIEPAEVTKFLSALGYEVQHEVTAKGHVSPRGDILDLWPPTAEWPIRVEFFGATVESIRAFDPIEQRSRETVTDVSLSPALELDARSSFRSYLPADTVTCLVEPDRIEHHAALMAEMLKAHPSVCAQPFSPADGFARIAFTLLEGPDTHRFAYAPLDGAPTLGENALRPDLMDEARAKFIAGFVQRAREQWSVSVYFATEGARARFAESHPDAARWFSIRQGALSEGFQSSEQRRALISETDLFGRRRELRGRYDLHAKRGGPNQPSGERIADWSDLQPGDLVVHVDHGIGKYLGLFEIDFNGESQEALTVEYAGGAKLYVPVAQSHLLSRYIGVGKHKPDLHALGGKRWEKDKVAAENAVRDLAATLLQTQAARDALPGHVFAKDSPWQHEFEASFPFQETPDQLQAIAAVKRDMEASRPMDRLICGDVGYGKTEVAMRAAFKAVADGKQAAMLVPTTVLAQQHFDTFTRRMSAWPLRIEMLSRFQTAAQQRDIVKRLGEGLVDIVIGTHRLVQSDVQFKNLGLVIIDEEQRFGVKHKEHLKQMRQLVDVLTLTATPIPRTLYMSLTGAKDLSTIQTPPAERLPIETIIAENTDDAVRRAILAELNREGQVFYLYNRVQSIEIAWHRLRKIVPEARIEIAHGQMDEKQLAFIMRAFVRGEFDVLLCTTIIESGLDIPNVNTIIIERADRFGMAELYQLRGRVGRYKRKAYAYLLLPRHGQLFDLARKRIGALKRYSSLGSGFKLALRDLELRGAGNILGSAQSGHIAAVGFDLYCQLLKRTVAQLKGEKPPAIIDVELALDFLSLSPAADHEENSASIPGSFVEDESQRIGLYRKIASAGTNAELDAVRDEIRDRFGKLPAALDRLLALARLRMDAAGRGISKIEVQEGKVLLTRRGNLITVAGKFPRLTAKGPANQIEELRRIARRL